MPLSARKVIAAPRRRSSCKRNAVVNLGIGCPRAWRRGAEEDRSSTC
jgi:hypothetical protein